MNLVEGLLFDRDQCEALNGCRSRWKKELSCGLPQGFILRPLLFAVFVNDLPQSLSSSVFMLADDTKLIHTIQSVANHN